jgi:hypothetical protein
VTREVQPLLIGAANAREMTGQSWAAVRRTARELGIRELRVSERRVALDARAYLEALHARAEREQAELTPEQEREQMRAMIGMRLIGGAR